MPKLLLLLEGGRVFSEYERQLRHGKDPGVYDTIEIVSEILETVPHRSVLELGCGQGFVAEITKDIWKRYLGIDASEVQIRLAKAKAIPNAEFIHSKIEEFESDEVFDAVICIRVAPHLDNAPDLVSHLLRFKAGHYLLEFFEVEDGAPKYIEFEPGERISLGIAHERALQALSEVEVIGTWFVPTPHAGFRHGYYLFRRKNESSPSAEVQARGGKRGRKARRGPEKTSR